MDGVSTVATRCATVPDPANSSYREAATFLAWLRSFLWRKQHTIFALYQVLVKFQQRQWPNSHSDAGYAFRSEEPRPEIQQKSIQR